MEICYQKVISQCSMHIQFGFPFLEPSHPAILQFTPSPASNISSTVAIDSPTGCNLVVVKKGFRTKSLLKATMNLLDRRGSRDAFTAAPSAMLPKPSAFNLIGSELAHQQSKIAPSRNVDWDCRARHQPNVRRGNGSKGGGRPRKLPKRPPNHVQQIKLCHLSPTQPKTTKNGSEAAEHMCSSRVTSNISNM